ncbi:MAG: GGDEF domain-containing protein [Woeseiaceae bacterium]|nr:GGDEF domain-containing protein [Woeseiaceae bacterium]
MAKLQESGLESWHALVQSQSSRSRIEEMLPLILSAAGALGVTPFAVMRYMNGDWLIAIIDTLIICGFIMLGTFVYRTRQVRLASVALSLLCIIGVVASVYASGPARILWAYPALMAVFYLMKPREAILLSLTLVALLLPRLLPADDTFHTTTILITIVVMSAFAFAFSIVTNWQHEILMQLATKDPLTGAGNRHAFEEKLASAAAVFERNGTPASLILMDLDHFKQVNDRHGHAMGDQILCRVTEIVNLRIRVTDSLYRIGGEEFVVVLEGQNIDRAVHLAEQLRTLVEANELVPDELVTISLGVAELQRGETPGDWLHRADEALYQSKRQGRNRTCSAPNETQVRPRVVST